MKAVYKYVLTHKYDILDYKSVTMPKGAEICKIDWQKDNICIWALIDPHTTEFVERQFRIAGTGHPIEEENIEYYNTIQYVDLGLIYHIFEVISYE